LYLFISAVQFWAQGGRSPTTGALDNDNELDGESPLWRLRKATPSRRQAECVIRHHGSERGVAV